MVQVKPTAATHDVVVIGSGAGGGTVTKVLTDLGISVLLHRSRTDDRTWATSRSTCGRTTCRIAAPGRMPRRTSGGRRFTYSANFGGAQIEGEPYTVAQGSDFSLVPIARPRRADEPLRPRHAALRRLRLQAAHARRAGMSTGRSVTRTSRRTTTRPSGSSASPARRKASAARRTASSTRRRRRGCTTC